MWTSRSIGMPPMASLTAWWTAAVAHWRATARHGWIAMARGLGVGGHARTACSATPRLRASATPRRRAHRPARESWTPTTIRLMATSQRRRTPSIPATGVRTPVWRAVLRTGYRRSAIGQRGGTTVDVDIVELDRRTLVATGDIVAALRAGDLDRPTPCAGWTVRDLLAHMIGQHYGFAAAASGEPTELADWRPRPVGDDPAGGYDESAAPGTAAVRAPRGSRRPG